MIARPPAEEWLRSNARGGQGMVKRMARIPREGERCRRLQERTRLVTVGKSESGELPNSLVA